jgi:hypothetical protein
MARDFYIVRKHPRVNVDFFADWGTGPEYEFHDRITSLSLGGCFLATRRELHSGDEIFLRWSGEISGPINLKGAIKYQLRVMEEARGAGIQFLGVSSESEKRLQAVLSNYR